MQRAMVFSERSSYNIDKQEGGANETSTQRLRNAASSSIVHWNLFEP